MIPDTFLFITALSLRQRLPARLMMNQPDVEELVRRSQQGDQAAFELLARQYEVPVYNLAYRMTGDSQVAQDILQDTLTAAYRQIHRFKSGNFRAWVFRIAVNASKDFLRSADHRRQVSLESLAENSLTQWQDASESPEDYSLRRELAGILQQAILRLPTEQRAVIILIDVQGLDYQAAAQVLNAPAGTVKSRLSRARAALRLYLAPHAELFPSEFRLNR